MMPSQKARVVAATFLFALGYGATAAADPTFPAEVKRVLMMPCDPDCTICHRDNQGNFGTLIGMGQKLKDSYGLLYYDISTVATALEADRLDNSDVDGDGIGDVEELEMCMDPNTAGGDGLVTGEPIQYGCFARVARSSPSDGGALPVLVAGGALAWAARRRRRA